MPTNGSRRHVLAAASLAVLLAVFAPSPARAQDDPGPVIRRGRRGPVQVVPGTQPATAPGTQPATRPTTTKPVTKLSECLDLYNKGQYAGAAEGYRKFLGDKDSQVAASIGMARALAMEGNYAQAIEALSGAAEAGQASADWQVQMADALSNVGKYEEALAHVQKACDLSPAWAPAILVKGNLLEVLGRREQAVETYQSMDKTMEKDDWRRDARSLVALGRILDRFTILTGKKASAQGDNIYNNYLRAAYQNVDEKYWPAYVAAGMFALSKSRPQMAAGDFQAADKINKRIPDVHIGLGALNLGRMNFEAALKEADEALKINPRHVDGHLLKAICMMLWRKHADAIPHIEKALKTNPNSLDALSLMAAVHICMHHEDKAQPFIERVGKVNPRCAELEQTIGQWLSTGRQFAEAEKHFLKAIELAPQMPEPVTELGLLYMQTGEEDKAREALQKAHQLDDYRADVVNYLGVLDKLAKFRVKETAHFIVKVDPEHDAVLLNQVSDFMESIYDPITRVDYQYEMPFKTIIEIFPTQTQFSTRLSGRGWIPTVGACTGRVIVLAAPAPQEERTPLGTHNWAVVLSHEFTHVVTLTCTNNRIPHWFTEACAVWHQPDKEAYNYVRTLVNAVRTQTLFSVKDMDWGFIRPRRPTDRQQAYAQSEWTLQYIIQAKGYDVVPKMLAGFRDGLTQADVFEKIVGMSEKDFDKAFAQWARTRVKEWGFNPDPPPKLAEAEKAAADRPADPNAQADHAVALYYARRRSDAMETADKALALDPNNGRALGIKAFVLLGQKKYDEAIDAAVKLEGLDHSSIVSPRVLAECYQNMKGDEIALRARTIEALKLLQQRQPLDQYSYDQLARLYHGWAPALELPNLVHLHRHTMRDPKYARQAAEIYRSMKQYDQALAFYQQVLHINPYDASAYEAIAGLELSAKRYDKAVDAAQNGTLLQPASGRAWTILAKVRRDAGKAARNKDTLLQARSDAQKAISIEPDGPAKDILATIEEALKEL